MESGVLCRSGSVTTRVGPFPPHPDLRVAEASPATSGGTHRAPRPLLPHVSLLVLRVLCGTAILGGSCLRLAVVLVTSPLSDK